MGKSASQPQTPDPVATANAQGNVSEAVASYNAMLNNSNQVTPYGTSSWTAKPGGQWTQTISLSPSEQKIFNNQQAANVMATGTGYDLLNNAFGMLSKPITASSLPKIQNSVNTNFGNLVNQAQNSAYNSQMALYGPQQQQQQESLQAQLAAQGVVPGSEAYNNAINNQQRQIDFQNTQIANNAVQTGNAMQNQLFGQSLNAGQFANTAQQQSLAQALQLQNQPVQIWQALSGNGVQMPQGASGTGAQASTPDLSGDIWNAFNSNLAKSNATTASNNQTAMDAGTLAMMAYIMM